MPLQVLTVFSTYFQNPVKPTGAENSLGKTEMIKQKPNTLDKLSKSSFAVIVAAACCKMLLQNFIKKHSTFVHKSIRHLDSEITTLLGFLNKTNTAN